VLGIWGTIAYKIINGISSEKPGIIAQNFDTTFNPKTKKVMDTFSISAVERDPFLGTLSTKSQVTKKKSGNRSAKDTSTPSLNITYGGLIQKQNSKAKVFVVNINNQQYLLKKGQTINDVKLINGNKESIVVRFNGKSQTIKL